MSTEQEVRSRQSIADFIRSNQYRVAESVTEAFLVRHPDWLTRYGDRAHISDIDDARHHQDFLAAAIEAGTVDAFRVYARWAARMLRSRQIAPVFLAESIHQIGAAFQSVAPPDYQQVIDLYVRSGIDACTSDIPECDPGSPSSELAYLYVEAALHGRRQAAIELIMQAVQQGQPIDQIYSDVLQAAMYRIGALWESNQITIAQEHMATAITQYVLAQLYPLIQRPSDPRGRILITGIEGEHHQLGGNMVADMLELDGWDVHFLGTNTPIEAIIAAVREQEPDIIGISATMLFNLPKVRELTQQLQRTFAARSLKIIVGGAAFRHAPHFYKDIGANACAFELRSAVQAVDALHQTRL